MHRISSIYNNSIKAFYFLVNNPIFLICISITLGVCIFGHYFDFTVVEPFNTGWIMNSSGDPAQHYLGSFAFRSDVWHFPITKTTYINYPEGLAIVYTDSNPLLAVIAKILRPVFPPHYQYTGIWYLICYILQSVIGYLLIKKITGDSIFALLSGVLFCLMPPMINRTGHENLMAFWLILWACYIFINDSLSASKKSLLFFTAITIASLTHAYLCVMVLFIAATWYIWQFIRYLKAKDNTSLIKFLCLNCAYGIAFLLILWIFGYIYNSPKANGLIGYGFYSMNLLAPFNAFDSSFSVFLNSIPIRDGQYEGFQYWGLGVIVLLTFITFIHIQKYAKELKGPFGFFLLSIFAAILLLKHNEILLFDKILLCSLLLIYAIFVYILYKEKAHTYLLLFIPATLCFILAVSNIITLRGTLLFEYPLNDGDFIAPFLGSVRSSGRLFWVTTHVLIISALFLLYKLSGSAKRSIALLSVIVFIQFLDLYNKVYVVDSKNKNYKSQLSEYNQQLLLKSSYVNFVHALHVETLDFALLNHKPINNYHTVHQSGQLTAQKLKVQAQDFQNNVIRPKTLYLFQLSDIPFNKTIHATPYNDEFLTHSSIHNNTFVVTPSTLYKKNTDTLSTIIHDIKISEYVIIAVKDEAVSALDPQFSKQFDLSFNTHLSELKYRQSYYAVFNNGVLISEKIGSESSVEFNQQLNCMNLYVKSAGIDFGNTAIVNIDNFNYSLNARGINVVTVSCNASNTRAITTMNFDTYLNPYK